MKKIKPAQPDDGLLRMLLEHKPTDGEDFFAISIVTDSDEPTWDLRQTFAGTYEQAVAYCVGSLGQMAQDKRLKRGAQIEFYQGEGARQYLQEMAQAETDYQQEQQARDKN
jgi:hypothetical protein